MPSSRMLRSVAHVRTDVWEELSASIARVSRIGVLRTANDAPSWLIVTLLMRQCFPPKRWRNIPENGILHNS
jgi:hypothetical protein